LVDLCALPAETEPESVVPDVPIGSPEPAIPTVEPEPVPVMVEETPARRKGRGLPRPRNPVEVKGEEQQAPARNLDPAWEEALRRAQVRLDDDNGPTGSQPRRKRKGPRKLRVMPASLEDRDDLIAEVLAERKGTGRQTPSSAKPSAKASAKAPPKARKPANRQRGYVA
jgi:hypothetical protein